MKVATFDYTGKKLADTQLPGAVFGQKVNRPLLAQAVRVYLANQRQGGAKTKRRGEVARTKAKWYRQKGTGRARHGSRNAPIFVGGGVAHGPTGGESYKLRLPTKMRRVALVSALGAKAKDKEVKVVKNLAKLSGKTKEMASLITTVGTGGKRVTVVLPEVMEKVIRAGRNLPNVSLVQARQLNPYEVVSGGELWFEAGALKVMEDKFKLQSPKSPPTSRLRRAGIQKGKRATARKAKKTTKKEK